MKIVYLDCFSGVSGDMLLGALVDAGVDGEALKREIAKLGFDDLRVRFTSCRRAAIGGTKAVVEAAHDHHHRSLSKIEGILAGSRLDQDTKDRSRRIFRRLGEVEAAIHQTPVEKIHFHEVGALDALADVVGACAGFRLLEVEKVYCSPINVGGGTVKAAHGVMPVPAPATAALLSGAPIYSEGPAVELTTPTGAAIVTEMAEEFGPLPPMTTTSVGYGAGDRDFKDRPNLLRVMVGKTNAAQEAAEVHVIEANVDDMSPQLAGYVRERLLDAGALDVTLTPIFMKKDRPGFMLSVLSAPADHEKLGELIFVETTTLGLRSYPAARRVLERRWEAVDTKYGSVRVKVASENGTVRNVMPEYEDCKKIALDKGLPLKDVLQQAGFEYWRNHGAGGSPPGADPRHNERRRSQG